MSVADTLWCVIGTIQNDLINSTATADTNHLNDIDIPAANREIDNFIFAFLDGIPLTTNLTNELIAAANMIAAESWWITQKDYKQAQHLRQRATTILESVKVRARATPTTRTRLQGRNKGYYSDPLQSEGLLPDMTDNYY